MSTNTASPIPITILTGFLGAGKTTLLLNLLPQFPSGYRLCLLKNEFGDIAVDSQLAAQSSIAGVTELLNGCICCNLVGQLSDALIDLKENYKPSRIVIETSGSAFPATLAMEVNRVCQETYGAFCLDGVIQVIDVENWAGYEDTSYTAKLQAKYTDLIVLNKHEHAGAQREDEVLDRVRDVAEDTPVVRSNNGWIAREVVFGIDSSLARNLNAEEDSEKKHAHDHAHTSEVDVLSLKLPCTGTDGGFCDSSSLQRLLSSAPKDEVYRIKGIMRFRLPPPQHPDTPTSSDLPTTPPTGNRWILNWAFGRWTFTPLRESSVSTTIEAPDGKASPVDLQPSTVNGHTEAILVDMKERKGSIEVMVETSIRTTVEEKVQEGREAARLSFVLARGEGEKWKRRLLQEDWIRYDRGDVQSDLEVHVIANV